MSSESKLWPCDELPLDWRRPELEEIKKIGYCYEDPWEVVELFENKIAEFAGSKYAVATQSCTNSIDLCLDWFWKNSSPTTQAPPYHMNIPSYCYVSVPMIIKKRGLKVWFRDEEWIGCYEILETSNFDVSRFKFWDCAPRFTKNMYIHDQFQCLSFQIKKRLPIGRGGMILTNNEEAAKWFRLARYDGRDLKHPDGRWQNEFEVLGRHCYLTPEDAARGLILFHKLMEKYPDGNIPDCQSWKDYPDLSRAKIFK